MAGECRSDTPLLRDLDSVHMASDKLTRAGCISFCEQAGTLYAGVQAGTSCFCGDKPRRRGKMLLDHLCSKTCPGDSREACGGKLRYNLLRTRVAVARPVLSKYAIAGICSARYPCGIIHTASLMAYAQIHKLDLHLHDSRVEPLYPVAFSKLTILQRLLNLEYSWIWWLDCDTVIFGGAHLPLASIIDRHLDAQSAEQSREVVMIAGYEPWGWVKVHGEIPSHPVNTGSFFLRGRTQGEVGAGIESNSGRLLQEWAALSNQYRSHNLWEQQAFHQLLRPELVPGRSREAILLRNGSVLVFANPSFNAQLCPTTRTRDDLPLVLHAIRGVTSVGRCEPAAARNLRQKAAILRDGGWKALLLGNALRFGIQHVRRVCCTGVNFRASLYKRHWGGYISKVNSSDSWPPGHGLAISVGNQTVERLLQSISACGTRGDVAPMVAASACKA